MAKFKKVIIKGTEFDTKKMHPYDVKTTGKHPIHMIEGGSYLTEDKRDFGMGTGDMGWFFLNQKEYEYYKAHEKDIEVEMEVE